MKLQYVDIDKVTTVKLSATTGFKLADPYDVKNYEEGILTVTTTIGDTNKTRMALADNCAIYSIQTSGVVEKEDLAYLDKYCDDNHSVYIDWNDNNDDDVNKIVAIYVVENADD